MPKIVHVAPKYRRHPASGQAVVTLAGHDFYLGPYGTKASKAEYDRLLGEWLAGGRRLPHYNEAARVQSTVFVEAYNEFTGDQWMNQARFAKLLRERGFHNKKFSAGPHKNRMGWLGVGSLEGGEISVEGKRF